LSEVEFPSDRKIFCVGFNKSGTTTLHRIFTDQLSLRSAHNPRWTDWSIAKNKPLLDRHQAYSDGGFPSIKNLDQLYPQALFILNTRPLKGWIVSRHKAVQRSRAAVRWALTKYLPLGWIAGTINGWVLDNSGAAMLQWIRIRNSYHAHVIDYFKDRPGQLLILNIEDPDFAISLGTFLGVESALSSEIANRDGQGSTTRIILDAIGEKVGRTDSRQEVENLFRTRGLEAQADNLTFFPSDTFFLSKSASDHVLRILPFMRPPVRWTYTILVGWRSGARSFFAKGVLDTFIRFFRSESDLHFFTTVRRLGSASK
jgi:hypothetical protein